MRECVCRIAASGVKMSVAQMASTTRATENSFALQFNDAAHTVLVPAANIQQVSSCRKHLE